MTPSSQGVAISPHEIEIDGHRGCFLEAAGPSVFTSRPAILILASMLVRAKSYRTTMRALALRGWRVIVLEMPGCGRASKLKTPWMFGEYAHWLERFIAAGALDRPIIVGHSNSGPVALLAAAGYPQKTSSLILVDTIGADEKHSMLRVLRGRTIDAVLEAPLTIRAFHHAAYNLFVHPRNTLNQIRLAARADLLGVARAAKIPTLLGWGCHDHTMPLPCLERLRAAIPHASMHISQTGSHDWIVDEPEKFAAAVDAFAAEIDRRHAQVNR